MIRILHFADLHLGVETYGRPDPVTGLSSRLLDFLRAFDELVDFAIEEQVDMIGVSGLITPSLEEMVGIAREMQRLGMTMPLLIGGATTSKAHTAVKIAPEYAGSVVYVKDASRSVGTVSALLDDKQRPLFDARNVADQDVLRTRFDASFT